MASFRFLIIDSKDRRDKIEFLVRSVLRKEHEKHLCVSLPSADDTNDDSLWIVIAHRNDLFTTTSKGDAKTKDSITANIKTLLEKAELVIGYTGGAGGLLHHDFIKEAKSAGFANLDRWYRINQEVESQSYDEEGMREIVKWTVDQDRSYESLPRLLRSPESVEFQTSLSLLCQGYLAQNALNHRNDGGGVDTKGYVHVGKALKVMGWVEDEAAEKVSQTVVDLDLDAGQPMPGIAFWTDPFEGSKSLRDGIQSELPKTLSKLPDDIENLVKAIEDKNVSNDQFVDIVAKAYLELNEMLEAV